MDLNDEDGYCLAFKHKYASIHLFHKRFVEKKV
jgi:hypothetical protein